MRVVGLTGGIGSGKSTVASMLLEMGAKIIDADAISRASTQPGGLAMPALMKAFGAQLADSDGGLDRARMRALMLVDPAAKEKLEAIIHPLVGQEMHRQLAEAASAYALVVMDIPLLVEGGSRWRKRLDAVWVVDCLPQTQLSRVMARSAWPLEQVQAVMASQASRAQRLACADAVIVNEGLSLLQLRQQVETLVKKLDS